MAEILPCPLRASRPSSFSCFQTVFVFSKPCRYSNGNANAIPSFGPLRLPKRRARFRILSKSASGSGFSSSDFGLVSTAECSDGSIVFRFGNARDYETTDKSVYVDKADDAAAEGLINADAEEFNERTESIPERAISHSERPQRSDSAQVSREVKSVLGGDSSVVESVSNDVSESTVSLLELTATDTEVNDLSCSTSSINEISVDDNEDIVAAEDTSFEVDKVLNEAIGSDIRESTSSVSENGALADSISSELDSTSDVSDNSAVPASSKKSTDPEVANSATAGNDNGNTIAVKNMSTETPAEASLDKETSPSTFEEYVDADETETSMQLGPKTSSTNMEEVRASTADTSNVEELPIPGVVELHSTEDTPNREEISTGGFVLSSGAALLRHPSEGLTGGEDAYFVACKNWLGVADGVGQWSLEGTSDGLYARELMENCERIVSDCNGNPVNDPGEVLVRSVAESESPGSSTILVAHYDGQAFHVANIGDSGFMIIRNGAILQQSSPIVHEFNFPLHIERGDDPSELIEAYKIDLDEGDVIVTATDGLFDNLYDQDIALIVSESLEAGVQPQVIAESLASKAQEAGRSSSSRSPFADAAQAAGYAGYSGGKLDDVVVIVSLVQQKESSS